MLNYFPSKVSLLVWLALFTYASAHALPTKRALEVRSYFPNIAATNVSPATYLELTFSEPITKGNDGIIYIKNYLNDETYFQINVTDNAVVVEGNKATINLIETLPLGQQIAVSLEGNTFKNEMDEYFDGLTETSTWYFTVASVLITHTEFSPLTSSTCNSILPTLTMMLTAPVTLGTGTVKIVETDNLRVHEQFNIRSSQVNILPGNEQRIVFRLSKPLVPQTTYSVLIETTAFSNSTGAYIGITNPNIWFFTTQSIAPTVEVTTQKDSCGSGSFVIEASSVTGGNNNYEWYASPDGDPITDGDDQIINENRFETPLLTKDTIFYVAVYNEGCLSVRKTILLNVREVPDIRISQDTTIFEGQRVLLSASGGMSYAWQPALGLSDATSASPVATPTQTTQYKVTVTSKEGCSSEAFVTINVEEPTEDIFLPNLFSPNGDGKNDLYRLLSRNQAAISAIDFRIYDRAGNLLYQTQSIQEAFDNGWDGRVNGVLQPTDTYVWYLSGQYVNGKIVTFENKSTGSFVLMR
ncbi:MAG: T9SS type B sorting domain-containing protein [Thermonemataceae bacterium]